MLNQIVHENSHIIAEMAQECGIDWHKAQQLISFDGRSYKRGIELNKSYRGKVWVKSGRISAGDKEYPLITFKTVKHGGVTQVFNGFLHADKSEFKPHFVAPVAARPAPVIIDESEIRKQRSFETLLARYEKLPRETGAFKYLTNKFGQRDADYYPLDLRRDSGCMVFAIRNHADEIIGFQQIFAENIHGTDRNKNYVGKTSGGFVVIGDASRIYEDGAFFCEGLATGIACYNARAKRGNLSNDDGLPVVVCLDAGNLLNVVKSFHLRGCKSIFVAADNDANNPNGNTGVYVGMKAAREVGGTLYYPILGNGKKCDFCDTLNSPKIDLSKGSEYAYLLQLIRFAPKQQLKDLSRKLAYAIARECPRKMSEQQACEAVNLALAERGYSAPLTVKNIIHRDVKKRRDLVKKLNKICGESLIEHDLSGASNDEIAAHILESSGGFWYDNRGLGAGKTNMMIALNDRLPHDAAAYICHRVALIKDACGRFKIENYEEIDPRFHVQKMGVCANSMPKFSVHQRFRVLFIDEARQVLEHILSGSVENRQAVFDEFVLAIQTADLIVVSDTDLNDETIKFFKKYGGNKSHNIVKVEAGENDKTIHLVADHKSNMNNVLKAVLDGHNVIVASTSIKKTQELAKFLEENAVTDVLVINGENKGDEAQAAFLANPNAECVKYRAVIHSPTIGSGVSITTPHFAFNFLFNCGNLPANEALQMTARNRMSKHIFVSFSEPRNCDRVTSVDLLIEGEGLKTARYMNANTNGTFTASDLGKLRIELYSRVNGNLNDFANNFLLLAEINGVTINYDRISHVMDMLEDARLKGLSTRVKEKIIDDVFNSPVISEFDAEKLSEKQALTQAETDKLKRHLTTKMVGLEEIERDDVKNFEGGMMKVVGLYEIFNAEPRQLIAWDNENHKTKDKRYSKVSLNRLLVELFDVAASDGLIVTEKTATKFCNALKKNAAELAANGMGNYNKTFKRPMMTTGLFLKRFGLELVEDKQLGTGKRERVYLLKENKTVARYAANRLVSNAHI